MTYEKQIKRRETQDQCMALGGALIGAILFLAILYFSTQG